MIAQKLEPFVPLNSFPLPLFPSSFHQVCARRGEMEAIAWRLGRAHGSFLPCIAHASSQLHTRTLRACNKQEALQATSPLRSRLPKDGRLGTLNRFSVPPTRSHKWLVLACLATKLKCAKMYMILWLKFAKRRLILVGCWTACIN